MGHALMTKNLAASLDFYRDLLGFRISDFMRTPIRAYLMHVNARHHSPALVEAPVDMLHHLMVEMYSLDDVGQGYDLALADGAERVVATLGRHCNDFMTSFYQRTPGDFLAECGWGGRNAEPATWQPKEMTTVESYWAHHRLMRAVGAPEPLPADRWPGSQVLRAPVHVMDGN
jgi:catechol 2,3-dioxygenase-like lactoylglutathione lyase family enzyme